MSNDSYILSLKDNEIINTVTMNELPGFFSKTLEVKPGTQVLVFENGTSCGVVKSGTHTVQSFIGSLFSFMGKKDSVFYPFKTNTIVLNFTSDALISKDNLVVSGDFQLHISISDPALLVKNLLGSRKSYSTEQLAKDITPVVLGAMNRAIGKLSIEELCSRDGAEYLSATLEMAIMSSFERYGLKFENLVIQALHHEGYDELNKEKQEFWFYKQNSQVNHEKSEYELLVRENALKFRERNNELDLLEKQIQTDKTEGSLADISRRVGLRKEYRKMLQCDKFDEIAGKTEFEQFLFENDKAKLIRDKEKTELIEAFESEHAEAQKRRQAVLAKLDAQIDQDATMLRQAFEHQLAMDALDKEMEIARSIENEENRKWQVQIEQERTERKLNLERLSNEKAVVSLANEIEMEQTVQKKRIAAVNNAMAEEAEVSKVKVQRLNDQYNLEMDKKRAEQTAEINAKVASSQMEKLEQIQELNRVQDKHEMEMYTQKKRFDVEMDLMVKKSDNEYNYSVTVENHKHELDMKRIELDRLRILASSENKDAIKVAMAPELAIAITNRENNKEPASSVITTDTIDANVGQAIADEKESQNAMMKEMYEKLLQSKDADQENSRKMIEMMLNSMSRQNSQPPAQPSAPPIIINGASGQAFSPCMPTNQSVEKEVVEIRVCSGCQARVSDKSARFCPNCGKPL